jgi:multidrug resistance efflux pump
MQHDPIPVPWPLMWRRIRYQFVPVLTLLVSATLAGWLWTRHAGSPLAVGRVNALRASVASRVDGMLRASPGQVKLFDAVRSGQVVAQLDTSLLEEELAAAEAELGQLGRGVTAGPTTAPSAGNESQRLQGLGTAAQQAHIRELEMRMLQSVIKAPIGGTVVEIHRRPGEMVQAGQTIMVIAADRPDYIVSYVREDQAIRPAAGMAVDVRPREMPRTVLRSRVRSVGPEVERVPEPQLRDHRVPEWGVPVEVELPPDVLLKPGSLVDIIFH